MCSPSTSRSPRCLRHHMCMEQQQAASLEPQGRNANCAAGDVGKSGVRPDGAVWRDVRELHAPARPGSRVHAQQVQSSCVYNVLHLASSICVHSEELVLSVL